MTCRNHLKAILLAGASLLAISAAHADGVPAGPTVTADAASLPMTPSALTVNAGDNSGSSTATNNVGTIEVQGAGAGEVLGSGFIVPEDGTKERSTVTRQGIENSIPTANPFQIIGILPGVNQIQDDTLGLSGGTIRVRGLIAAQMGFTINGVPYNDSGSFAVYPNEIVDSENIDQAWLTQGSTDIDAPHVGASGGNIGIVTRAPKDNFNVMLEGATGEDQFFRRFAAIDTGWIGNVKGFVSYSDTSANKWRGAGTDNREHSDGNFLWQFLPHSSVGLTWTYNDSVNDYYRAYASSSVFNVAISGNTALQTFDAVGRYVDYDTFWGQPGFPVVLYGNSTTGPGATVVNPIFPTTNKTNVTNAYSLNLNPFRNLIANVPIHVQLTDNLRWEANPYLWWGSGAAGFGTTLTAGRATGGYIVPTEYGAPAGSVLLAYEAQITTTYRPGFTTKFVYDTDNYTFTVGGWLEHARQRQYEPFGLVNSNATPCDIWMVNNNVSNACGIVGTSARGTGQVEGYDDLADSLGESVFGEVTGRFFDDSLKITAGVAYRKIIRSFTQYLPVCADDPTLVEAAGATSTCASVATTTAFTNSAAYQYFNGPVVGATAAYAAMRQFGQNSHLDFAAPLPEISATYDLDSVQQIFAGATTGFRTPPAVNFLKFNSAGTVLQITDLKSEFDWSFEAGYRRHGDFFTMSATAFLQDVDNYQATIQVDPVDFITSNIGNVKIYGIDAEVGTRPWNGFTFYASGTLQDSVIANDIPADFTSGTVLQYVHTAGKQLVDTPNWIVSASLGYQRDGFFGSLTPHCVGARATALLNDEFIPPYCTVDASVGYRFGDGWGALKDATLQIYALNLLNANYLGEVTTQGQTNAKSAPSFSATGQALPNVPSESYSAYPGAPFFVGVRLKMDLSR